MADLTQTAANVGLADIAGATTTVVQAGEALTQGQPVYISASKYYRCDANDANKDEAVGIVLTPAATDEYCVIAQAGIIDLGATLVAGEAYYVSAASVGGIAPHDDLSSGDYVTSLGIATTTGKFKLDIVVSSATI